MSKMISSEVQNETAARMEGPAEHIISPESEKASELTFPEEGVRAWSVAIGCGGIMFCTFGYINAFG